MAKAWYWETSFVQALGHIAGIRKERRGWDDSHCWQADDHGKWNTCRVSSTNPFGYYGWNDAVMVSFRGTSRNTDSMMKTQSEDKPLDGAHSANRIETWFAQQTTPKPLQNISRSVLLAHSTNSPHLHFVVGSRKKASLPIFSNLAWRHSGFFLNSAVIWK